MAEVLIVYFFNCCFLFSRRDSFVCNYVAGAFFIWPAQRHKSYHKINVLSEQKNARSYLYNAFLFYYILTEAEEINKLQYFKLSLLKIQILIGFKSSSEIPH